MLRTLAIVAALSLLAAPAALAKPAKKAAKPAADKYLEPFPAHHVAGNIYFVGTLGQANYLITTPQGNILINSGIEGDVPMIKASIAKLGFKYSDTKILLISHAHFDHDAGSAQVIKDTGAKYEVMDSDVPVVQSGGKTDFNYGDDRITDDDYVHGIIDPYGSSGPGLGDNPGQSSPGVTGPST